MQKKAVVLMLIMLAFLKSGALPFSDSFHIYFDLNKPSLNKQAYKTIDSLLYHDIISGNKQLLIVGYADYLGSSEHNDTLSKSRAKAVQDYLVQMGIKPSFITVCIGKGEVERNEQAKEGYAPDRRVDIVLLNALQHAPPKTKITNSPLPNPKTGTSLLTVSVGQTIVLNKIYFYAGRHLVKEESIPELENLYQILEDTPPLKIQIEGHICCVRMAPDALDEGTGELKLSENRAKYIYDYLVHKGIDASRLKYRGFGRTRPVIPIERSFEDEDRNRRVEIRVLQR